jgi:hypothetical protein
MLQRLPRHLEQQTLLRIHAGRFTGRDAEELGVKLVHAINKTAMAYIHFARSVRVWIEVGIAVPPVRRNLADRVFTFRQHLPEGRQISGTSRKTQTDTDDGDRLTIPAFRLLQSSAQLAYLKESAFDGG